jgi:hypothetical protein
MSHQLSRLLKSLGLSIFSYVFLLLVFPSESTYRIFQGTAVSSIRSNISTCSLMSVCLHSEFCPIFCAPLQAAEIPSLQLLFDYNRYDPSFRSIKQRGNRREYNIKMDHVRKTGHDDVMKPDCLSNQHIADRKPLLVCARLCKMHVFTHALNAGFYVHFLQTHTYTPCVVNRFVRHF